MKIKAKHKINDNFIYDCIIEYNENKRVQIYQNYNEKNLYLDKNWICSIPYNKFINDYYIVK